MTRSRPTRLRSEEHTSELQSRSDIVCRLLLEKKKKQLPTMCSTPHTKSRDSIYKNSYHRCHTTVFSKTCRDRGDGSSGRNPVTFFFNDTATTEIYTLSLHDALPI